MIKIQSVDKNCKKKTTNKKTRKMNTLEKTYIDDVKYKLNYEQKANLLFNTYKIIQI